MQKLENASARTNIVHCFVYNILLWAYCCIRCVVVYLLVAFVALIVYICIVNNFFLRLYIVAGTHTPSIRKRCSMNGNKICL